MSIELIHGDCLVELKKIKDKSIDLVLTDPPYGVGKAVWDDNTDWKNLLKKWGEDIALKIKEDGIIICFSSTRYLDKTIEYIQVKYRWQFIWGCSNNMKTGDIGFAKYTPALIFSNKLSIHCNAQDLKDYSAGTIDLKTWGKFHPTPKPLPCIKYLLKKFTKETDTILDPFMGSGTTGVAAKELGRNFIGIEIDKNYFSIAEKRIAQATQELFI